VVRLRRVLEADRADLVVARTGAQAHPVFCLCRRELLQNLQAFLAGGGRKMDAWYAQLPHREVSFDNDAAAFSNINTPDELAAIERADVEPRQRA
jgi:molybdopterin-guanine dinucleotide biosynthesis protein A